MERKEEPCVLDIGASELEYLDILKLYLRYFDWIEFEEKYCKALKLKKFTDVKVLDLVKRYIWHLKNNGKIIIIDSYS